MQEPTRFKGVANLDVTFTGTASKHQKPLPSSLTQGIEPPIRANALKMAELFQEKMWGTRFRVLDPQSLLSADGHNMQNRARVTVVDLKKGHTSSGDLRDELLLHVDTFEKELGAQRKTIVEICVTPDF